MVDFSEQLRMFIPAKEALGYNFMDRGGSKESVIARKLSESERPTYLNHPGEEGGSLTDSIAKGGVRTPINVFHATAPASSSYGLTGPALFDGHHRVAVANAQDPDQLIPVVHDSSPAALYRSRAEVAAYKRREDARREARNRGE